MRIGRQVRTSGCGGDEILLATATFSFASPASARVVPGFGEVSFQTSCRRSFQAEFETAITRLHAFDDPEDAFKAVAAADPHCANRAASALYMGPGHDAAALDADDPHGLDFIAYAQLQLGRDDAVRAALADAPPSDERVLVQARYLLERGDWAGAAAMPTEGLSSFQRITAEFVRALGLAHTGQTDAVRAEVAALRTLRGPVLREHGAYWAGLVGVYAEAAEAWTQYAAGDVPGALAAMDRAADADDTRQKHILLENRLYPLRELYGDLLEAAGQPQQALAAHRASMAVAPNRLNGLLGAVRVARALRQEDAARRYAAAAAALVAYAVPGRPAFAEVRSGP